ncbi:MAG: hypothetical protein JHC93_06940 [Parachlamydiales bacterium]|nr:hypothetical protein [Parachlamydiales bacterium]
MVESNSFVMGVIPEQSMPSKQLAQTAVQHPSSQKPIFYIRHSSLYYYQKKFLSTFFSFLFKNSIIDIRHHLKVAPINSSSLSGVDFFEN